MRVISDLSSGTLPDSVRAQERAFASTAGQARSMRDELVALPAVMQRAQSLRTVGDKPVAIVTAEKDAMEGWIPLQAELAHLSTNSTQRSVPEASHPSIVDTEHDAAHASRAILDVVQSVRGHSRLDAPTAHDALTTPVVRPTAAVDQLVDVHGARMHVRCNGAGAVCAVPNDRTPTSQTYQQLCTYISTPAANAEHLDAPAAFAEVAKIDTVGSLPVRVLTAATHPRGLAAAEEARLNDVWRTGQDHWMSLSSSAQLVTVDNTGHNIQIDQRKAVIEQIQQLLA